MQIAKTSTNTIIFWQVWAHDPKANASHYHRTATHSYPPPLPKFPYPNLYLHPQNYDTAALAGRWQ